MENVGIEMTWIAQLCMVHFLRNKKKETFTKIFTSTHLEVQKLKILLDIICSNYIYSNFCWKQSLIIHLFTCIYAFTVL